MTRFNKIKLTIMMVTTVFSFTSMSNAFFLKGFSAIPWFLISGAVYFVPYLLIVSDLTTVYQDEAGGIYTWLKEVTSKRAAFVTTLLWYSSYFIWMISLFMKTWIPLSILLFGEDKTQNATVFGNIPTLWLLAVLALGLIAVISLIILGGFQKILDVSFLSGRCMLTLVSVMAIACLTLFVKNGGHPQENFALSQLFTSQGEFQTPAENLSFLIFGITAFGGLDTVACLVNKTGELKKQFAKMILIAGAAILTMYIVGIFLWGTAIDLPSFVKEERFHLGNLMYGLMGQLALNLGAAFGLGNGASQLLVQIFIRLTALTLFTAYISLLSIISYGPLQSLTQSLKETNLGSHLQKENRQGIVILPVIFQGVGLSIFVVAICLSQDSIGGFYNQLTLMTNISRSIPYLLVALSYPAFKRLYPTSSPLGGFEKSWQVRLISSLVVVSVVLSIGFSVYEKIAENRLLDAGLLILGPAVFAILGTLTYHFTTKRQNPAVGS